MKKVLCLLLCAVFLCSAFSGCGSVQQGTETTAAESTAAQQNPQLRVGFGRVDITPEGPVPLAGRLSIDYSTSVTDPLYATCIAFTDETDNTVLMFELDLLENYGEANTAKLAIARATGVNGLQILMCATHNHSGPRVELPEAQHYAEKISGWLVQAAKEAMADRKPAKLYTASARPEGMNFVRHYVMNDGTVVGDNFGTTTGKTYAGHVSEADNEMQLIKITRESGKDIVLMNWQGHPRATAEDKYSIMSDVHAIRKVLEPKQDCLFAYFLGASGNVNTKSRITAENACQTYTEQGQRLAQYVIDAYDSFREAKIGTIRFLRQNYQAQSKTNAAKLEVPMYAFSIGDVAFITAPYEMFNESGIEIKENSPFETTFVATVSNGSLSYMPVEYAFAYEDRFGYPAYEVTMMKFVKGTAEILSAEYVNMLKQLKAAG